MYHCIMQACIQSCLTFVTPWTIAHQAPLSMAFPRQEYWSGLPFPLPGECIYINLKCQWTERSNKKTKNDRLDRIKKHQGPLIRCLQETPLEQSTHID